MPPEADCHDVSLKVLGFSQAAGLVAGEVFPAKGFQLFAVLALSRGHRRTRKELATLLWDTADDAAALTNLRQLLTRMRRAFPEHCEPLETDTSTIALSSHAPELDLTQFRAFAAAPDLESHRRALELYQGDLLQNPGDTTPAFAEWLEIEQVKLRDLYFESAARVLMELTRYGRGPTEELKRIASQMLEVEPDREASYRVIIDAFGRNGMLLEVEIQFGELKKMLAREHGGAPEGQTLAVVRRVLSSSAPVPKPAAPPPPNEPLPRLAFLEPRWVTAPGAQGLLRALIEDVTNDLSRYRSFAPLAPHSSFPLKHDGGQPLDNSVIRADYSVSGFVKPGHGAEILSLRMVKCASGDIIWAGEFPFGEKELLRFFRQLSLRIATSLATGIERDMLETMRRGGRNKSYLLYLEGRQLQKTVTLPELRRARKLFAAAAEDDVHFGAPNARHAETLFDEWALLGGNDPHLLHQANHQSSLAISRDPNDATGHWMSGLVSLYQRDYDNSAERFIQAETLSPNNPDLLVEYGNALAHFGDIEEGLKRMEAAVSLNPAPPDHYWRTYAGVYFNAGDMTKTIEMCDRTSDDTCVLRLLAASHALAGNRAEARHYGARLRDTYPGQTADDMVGISPDRDPSVSRRFRDGLRLAGVQ